MYLDFLAPSFLHRNASGSATPSPRPPPPHSRQDRAAHTTRKLSNIPQRLASQIGQLISVRTKTEGPVPPTNSIDLFVKTVAKLDTALGRDELSGARKLWEMLVSRELLKYLGIPQLHTYSRSIASMYGRQLGSGDQWSAADRGTMQTIAIHTALYGHLEAINAVMLHHLTANEPDEVLELYRAYTTSRSKNRTPQPTEGVSIPDNLVPSEERIDVLLNAIAACAMKGSFSDAVNMVVKSHARIIYRAAEHNIHNLPNAPIVETYVQRLELVYLLAHPPAFLKHVNGLARGRATDKLEKLCKDMIAAILGEDPWLVVAEEQKSNERPVVVPRFTWTTLITALAKCKRPDLAGRLWEDMVGCGVKPDASIWTAVFDGYSASGAWRESLMTWDVLLTQDVEPEPLTYRAIIATLFKARRPNDAITKFKEYEENWIGNKGQRSADLMDKHSSQILSLYNSVLQGLLTSSNRDTHALALFERMKTDGPAPDLVSWNTIMADYGRRGNMKMISSTLRGLKESGFSPDVFTYSIILTALLKAGREDAPQLISDMMRKDGINPGAAVNTSIINQLLREPDATNIKAAFNILNRMEEERTPAERPNEVTYTTMLTGIYRWGSGEEVETYHSDIVGRMSKRGIQFNRATCHILIRASLESSSRDGTRYALKHFNQMVQLKIEPDFDTWYIILGGMLRRGEIQIANDLLEEMAKQRYEPTGPLVGLIKRIRRR